MTLDLDSLAKLPELINKLEAALARIEEAPAAPSDPNRILLTVHEAAKLTGMARQTLYQYISNRKIPHVRIGTSVYLDPQEFKTWIDGRRVPAIRKTSAGAA